MVFACGEDQKKIPPGGEQATKNDRIVFVSVLMNNSGFVRDAVVLDGPTTLRRAAIKTVRHRRYTKKEIDSWGTTRGKSLRLVNLAVTFPSKPGTSPTVRPGIMSGVLGCVPGGFASVVLSPSPYHLS